MGKEILKKTLILAFEVKVQRGYTNIIFI